jgi:FMN reductase
MSDRPLTAVGISGSPASISRSRLLLAYALARLADAGVETVQIDLHTLPAAPLLGRGSSLEVDRALQAVADAHVVVASTPVYRATYSGLLKVFFDLLPQDALAGKVAIPIAVGGVPGHQLSLEHGLRPLLASVGAAVVPTGIFGATALFENDVPAVSLRDRVNRAVAEALALSGAFPATPLFPHLSEV